MRLKKKRFTSREAKRMEEKSDSPHATNGVLEALVSRGVVDKYLVTRFGTSIWKRKTPGAVIKPFSTLRLNSKATTIVETKNGFRASFSVERKGDLLAGTDIKVFTKLNDFALHLLFPGKPKGMTDSLFYMVLQILLTFYSEMQIRKQENY